MSIIQWDESLSVKVKEIDAQHQKLINLLNELFDAMRVGKGNQILGGILHSLVTYTQTHFKNEEMYFDKFQYPDAVAHKAEHKKLVEKTMKFKTDFEAGKVGISIPLMDFLSNWLKDHIKGTDKKYGPFFNQNGLI